jgi:hypothetical protein
MWILRTLEAISSEIGLRQCVVIDRLTPQAIGPLHLAGRTCDRPELRNRVTTLGAELVMCTTADREQAEVLRPVRGFHVIRDPRDLVVSAYFSHRNSHPTDGLPHLQAHRAALREASLADGLFLEMAFSTTELLQIADWDYANDAVLEWRMEDLIRDPYGGFLKICDHLGLLRDVEPLRAAEHIRVWLPRLLNRSRRWPFRELRLRRDATAETVLGAAHRFRFEARSGGRARGREDVDSPVRKGVAGDWINHFSRCHAEAFDTQFGDLLVNLGYEQDSEWVMRAGERP